MKTYNLLLPSESFNLASEMIIYKDFGELTFPRSYSFVVMTMTPEFSCHTICQKSDVVVERHPWVAIYLFVGPFAKLSSSTCSQKQTLSFPEKLKRKIQKKKKKD